MPVLTVHHTTRYRYRKPVAFGEHRMMLRPRESYDQRILSSRLDVSPAVKVRYVDDVFGNTVGVAQFETAAEELVFDSEVRLEHTPAPLVSDDREAIAADGATFPFAYDGDDVPDLLRSIERRHADPNGEVGRYARRFMRYNGATPVLSLLAEMTHAIPAEFAYAQRLEAGVQTPAETLALQSGTCRDFAMLMIEAARSLGLAARFVSGYLYSPGGEALDTRRKGGGHTHAWAQVYLPSCGWAEFDPTNGIVGNRDLIRVAVVRDPRQASPLSGSYDGEADDFLGMDVSVDVAVEPAPAPLRMAG